MRDERYTDDHDERGRGGVTDARRARTRWGRSRALWLSIFLLFGLIYIEPMWMLRDLGADDLSYVAHSFTLGLDLDFDYSNEPVLSWNRYHTVPAHPVGTGVLAAPFVAVGGVVDRIQGNPVVHDHHQYRYSWAFFGLYVAALFYFGLVVWLYWRAIRLVWPGVDPRLNLLLAVSTGVPFYALRRFTMSHAFEFAVAAFCLWAAVRLYRALGRDGPTRRWMAAVAVGVALSLLIRLNNLNLVILGHTVVLVLYLYDPAALPRPDWPRVRGALVRLGGWLAVAAVPLLLFNLWFYGALYPTPSRFYDRPLTGMAQRTSTEVVLEGLTRVPHLVPLIFGSEWGILYSNPVLVIGGAFLLVLGVRRLIRRPDLPSAAAMVLTLAFFGLSTAIVLWWQSTASSYGYRYLLPLYPLALLGVALAMTCREWLSRRVRKGLLIALVALSGVSVVTQVFFSASEPLEVQQRVNTFGIWHGASAAGYMVRLPREIVRSETWVSLASRRLTGFFAGPYVVADDELRGSLPEGYVDAYERLYRPAPPRVYVQLGLLLAFWVATGWVLVRPAPGPAAQRAPDPRRTTGPAPPVGSPSTEAPNVIG